MCLDTSKIKQGFTKIREEIKESLGTSGQKWVVKKPNNQTGKIHIYFSKEISWQMFDDLFDDKPFDKIKHFSFDILCTRSTGRPRPYFYLLRRAGGLRPPGMAGSRPIRSRLSSVGPANNMQAQNGAWLDTALGKPIYTALSQPIYTALSQSIYHGTRQAYIHGTQPAERRSRWAILADGGLRPKDNWYSKGMMGLSMKCSLATCMEGCGQVGCVSVLTVTFDFCSHIQLAE
jgi:hypothetical protein